MVAIYWFHVPVQSPSVVSYGDEIFGRGDGGRFVAQGWWLRSGKGFREGDGGGSLCTSLPPGYPAFLGCLFLLTEQPDLIRLFQAALHVSSGIIFFYGCRRYGSLLAFIGGLVISASPWAAAQCSVFMSEVLSTFLSVCLGVGLLRLRKYSFSLTRCYGTAFFTGGLASMACLTAPALAPVCAGIVLICLLLWKRYAIVSAALLTGACLPMLIWQAHCVVADGRPCLTLLTPLRARCAGEWICTWARTEREAYESYHVFDWSREPVSFDRVPDHAFRNQREKEELLVLTNAAAKERGAQGPGPCVEQLRLRCDQIAAERRSAGPVLVRLILPFSRALSSLCSLRPVDFRSLEAPQFIGRLNPFGFSREVREFGWLRASFRVGRGLLALWSFSIHVAIAVLVICAFFLFSGGDWLCRSLLGLLLIFLLTYGTVTPEARRLIPSVPLFLAVYPLWGMGRSWKSMVHREVA
ncbi:MAG: hypothetical protein RLZZ536_893 [Planctomycetota bacterium]